MWNPKSLKIVNLFSHEESFFEFSSNQTTTVYGINKTDQNVQSNGSGKTSILDCISISLIGEPLRDISKKEIVRNGEKSGECEFILQNDVLKKTLKIKREINSTKSNNALIWINDEPDNNLKDLSPSETDKYILKLLGVSKDDLRNYFLISKDSYQSFFLNGDVAKKEIINRFSKANMVDPVEPLIKADIDLLDGQIKELQTQKTSNEGVLQHLDEELNKEKLESSIEKTRQLIIKTLEEKKEGVEKSKEELPTLIKDKETKIAQQEASKELVVIEINHLTKGIDKAGLKELELEGKIIAQVNKQDEVELSYKPKFKVIGDKVEEEDKLLEIALTGNQKQLDSIETTYQPQFDEIVEEVDTCNAEIDECNESIKEQDKIIGEIEKNIADKIDCPKCKHSFILRDKDYGLVQAKKDLNEAKDTKSEIEELIQESTKNITVLATKTVALKNEKAGKISQLNSTRQELREQSKKNQLKFDKEAYDLKDELNKETRIIIDHKILLKADLGELQGNITKSKGEKKNKELRLSQEESTISKLHLELGELNTKSTFYDSQIKDIDKSIKEEQKKKYDNDPLKTLEEKIATLTEQTKDLQDEIELWERDKGNLQEWQVRFKQFKSFLANTSISAIEQMTNHFLDKMKTTLTVQIDGYRELANKKLKEEITCMVTRDGLNGESFSKFSGGEKAKMDLAMILSMQKIINVSSEGGGLNLIFIDEILESVDSLALSGVIKALSQLEQTILIITHVDQNNFECNKLQVEKINGVSKVLSL